MSCLQKKRTWTSVTAVALCSVCLLNGLPIARSELPPIPEALSLRSLVIADEVTTRMTPAAPGWSDTFRSMLSWSWYTSSSSSSSRGLEEGGGQEIGVKKRSRLFRFNRPQGVDRLPSRRGGSIATATIPDGELSHLFQEETAVRVNALFPEEKQALAQFRQLLFGEHVSLARKQAADQMVVCGDRDAMLLSFLSRKMFNAQEAYQCIDRILEWR